MSMRAARADAMLGHPLLGVHCAGIQEGTGQFPSKGALSRSTVLNDWNGGHMVLFGSQTEHPHAYGRDLKAMHGCLRIHNPSP